MKKDRVPIIALFSFLAVLILWYFIYNKDEKHFSWFENYRASSEEPYGTKFIQKMLESYRPGNRFDVNDKAPLRKFLKDVKEPRNTDYILIGHEIFLDEESRKALVDFIEAGGNAFIATLAAPTELINAVYFRECGVDLSYQQNFTKSVTLNFFQESLKSEQGFSFAFRFIDLEKPYSWAYVNPALFCDSTKSIVPLGSLGKDFVDFIKIPAGKGNLFLHTNPLVFTNYFLTKREKVDYASRVFSHLDGKNLIWDEYSKIMFGGDSAGYNNPLYYILQHPSLKYAWWLLLGTVVLYVFFAAKRRQRVIPVREAKTNTSLEFVNLISRLHYKNGNHVDMARKKMKYFLYFVRSKYGIHAETFKDEHLQKLAEKSRVNLADVRGIFAQYYLIEEKFRDNIEANRLVGLYDSIENFYKHCK